MFAIRSTQRVSGLAVAAAAVGTCLLLSACGGGSNGSAASGSGGSSSSSSAPATSASVAPDKGLLTGNFCKDLTNLGKVSNLTPAEAKKIGTNMPAMASYLKRAAADFDGLGSEGPPNVKSFMHVLANEYTSLANLAASGAPLSKLKAKSEGVETEGASGQAFRKLVQYVQTSCGV
jgi:hypothetical protein